MRLYETKLKEEDLPRSLRDTEELLRRIRLGSKEQEPKLEASASTMQQVPQWFLDHLKLIEERLRMANVPESEWKFWGGI